jgi:hypothetical protein
MLLFWLIAYTPALFYFQLLFYSVEVREFFTGFVLGWRWIVVFMVLISGVQIWLPMRDWLPKRGESVHQGNTLALKGIDRYRQSLLAGAFAFLVLNWFAFAPLMDLLMAGIRS